MEGGSSKGGIEEEFWAERSVGARGGSRGRVGRTGGVGGELEGLGVNRWEGLRIRIVGMTAHLI